MTALGFTLLLAISSAALSGQTPQGRACSEADVKAAFSKVEKFGLMLKVNHRHADWPLFHKLYRKYRHCDDGAIAEGFSDIAARLVAYRWASTLGFLAARNENDDFLVFALRHLDATDDANDLLRARKNAVESCPPDDSVFCARIDQACIRALEPLLPDGL